MKKIFSFIFVLFFTSACSNMSDVGKVLKNEKVKNTDEFLVKKKEPLVLPPDYKIIPKPGSQDIKKKSNGNTIEEILKTSKDNKSNQKKTSSTEESILNRIRK